MAPFIVDRYEEGYVHEFEFTKACEESVCLKINRPLNKKMEAPDFQFGGGAVGRKNREQRVGVRK